MLTWTSQSLDLYTKTSPRDERHICTHPWFCVLDSELWQTMDYEAGFYLSTPKPKSVTLHILLVPPPSSSLSFFLSFLFSHFHPLLMCRTLILNIPFPMFWSNGFTCRWAGNLHQLKGLPFPPDAFWQRCVYSSSVLSITPGTLPELLPHGASRLVLHRRSSWEIGLRTHSFREKLLSQWHQMGSSLRYQSFVFWHKVTPSVILSRAESISQTPSALWILL